MSILAMIALGITASAFYYAVNYGKQKAETKCQAEKTQVAQEQAREDRTTIKQREEADEYVRNQDRDAIVRDLGDVWLCHNDCEL